MNTVKYANQVHVQPEPYVLELIKSQRRGKILELVKKHATIGPVPHRGSQEWYRLQNEQLERARDEFVGEDKLEHLADAAARIFEQMEQYIQ